ncbi:unnamed protein product [Ostreobium quekettii]|uniref:Cupin type-2 domain-containing protein n=1 Tax=Ostreobium quekettii TaxID=121088 RepID=A0A8S1ITJ4_9CHLO|nr:unnamed protein product [Ostreobium quekettii]
MLRPFQSRPLATNGHKLREDGSRPRPVPTAALKVEKWDERRDGSLSKASVAEKLRKQGYTTNFYTFNPGTVFPDHSHQCHKKDSIVSGRMLFRMKGEEIVLQPGDMLEVPKGATHYAAVVGADPVVFVDASKK